MSTLAITAHHEAAHAVVLFRMIGVAENVSVVPKVTTSADGEVSRILGHTSDTGYSDSFNASPRRSRCPTRSTAPRRPR